MTTIEDFSVKKELRRFGETTSVRGVPRALKSSDQVLRVIWIMALVVSVSMTIWQLQKVFAKYLKYEKVSTIKDVSNEAVFPWVTVCSQSPLGDDINTKLNWTQFVNDIQARTEFVNNSTHALQALFAMKVSEVLDLLKMFSSPFGYIANLPMPTGSHASHRLPPFVVDCDYFDWQLNRYAELECSNTIHEVWDPNYYRCYSFRPPANSSKLIRALTGFFYVGDFFDDQQPFFSTNIGMSQASGIKVSVHAPGTGAKIEVSEKIGPGTETLIHVSQTKNTRLPDPYGTCTEQLNLDGPDVREGANVYTSDICFGLCLQQQYVDRCRCVYAFLPFNESQLERGNYMSCGNQSLLSDKDSHSVNVSMLLDFVSRQNCVLSLSSSSPDNCDCPDPCQEYSYDVRIDDAPWPHRTYQLAFYETFIAPHQDIYGNRFDVYGEIAKLVGNITGVEVMTMIDNAKLIKENFVRVDVLFDSYSSLELAEVPAMTDERLAANIGGVLSLWMGITTIALIEIIELLYNMARSFKRSRDQTGPTE